MPARARGFTLIELLVALAIFAVLCAMAYAGLAAIVRARGHLADQAHDLAALQLCVGLIERDLRQAVPRPIRDAYGEQRAALVGSGNAIELSALSATSATFSTRPAVGRVAYALAESKLQRATWPVLDRTPGTRAAQHALLERVERISWRFLDRANPWIDIWPPARADAAALESLPRAVEVRIVLRELGEVSRLIELPEPVQAQGVLP